MGRPEESAQDQQSDRSPISFRVSLSDFLACKVLPAGLFLTFTGLLWSGGHSYFPKIYLVFVAIPTVLLALVDRPSVKAVLNSPIVQTSLCLFVLVVLSLLWANPEKETGSLLYRPLLIFLLFVAVFVVQHRAPSRLINALRVSALIAAFLAGYSLIEFLMSPEARLSRYGGLSNPLLASHLCGFFVALCLGDYLVQKKIFLPLHLIILAIFVAFIVATGSRTPIVAFSATVFWLVLLTGNQKAKYFLASVVVIGIVAVCFFPEIFMQRGLSYRPQIWSEMLRQITEKPLFGYGYNTPISIKLPDFNHAFREPHNLTLSVVHDLGVVGGLLWVTIYAIALGSVWRLRRFGDDLSIIFSASVVYGLMAGMTEGGSYLSRPKEHWFLVWIPLALLAASLHKRRCSS